VLGNPAANAIAIGRFITIAAGGKPDSSDKASAIGIAIAALTLACLVHVASRRGGVLLNNIFAVVKLMILVCIIIIGFMFGAGYSFGGRADRSVYPTGNFNSNMAFDGTGQNTSSFATSLLFVFFAYSGFAQPFYVSLGLPGGDRES
jgi:amino acid transporter